MNMIKFYSPAVFEPRSNRFFDHLKNEKDMNVPKTNIIESEKEFLFPYSISKKCCLPHKYRVSPDT